LTFGYNTGVFNIAPRLRRIPNLINMDGMEWKRNKYSEPVKKFLFYAEKLAVKYSDFIVADALQTLAMTIKKIAIIALILFMISILVG